MWLTTLVGNLLRAFLDEPSPDTGDRVTLSNYVGVAQYKNNIDWNKPKLSFLLIKIINRTSNSTTL